MQFESIHLIHLMWALIPLMGGLFWFLSRKKRKIQGLIQEDLIKDIVPSFKEASEKKKIVLLGLVWIFSILALIRPQWGFEWQEVKKQGLDILVVVDVSKSMLTQDIKPNRLERTKLAVRDLLKKLQGDRIGLVAFAGDAFLFCPLTTDYAGFLLSVNDLSVNTVSRGGTNLSVAIEEAIKGYDNTPTQYKAVIIVSDGDNLEGDPMEAAKKAKEKGIKIYCIGIGTKEGELIQVTNQNGEKEFLKDRDGNFVKSRLNEKVLEGIALATGGVYVKSSGAEFGLDLIYDRELSRLEKREIESEKTKRYYERFQIPLAIALFFLIYETFKRYNE